MRVQTLYRELMERGRQSNTATGTKGEGLSAHAVRGVHATLQSALNDAVQWQLIARNPVASVEPPRIPRTQQQTLTVDEAQRLLEASKPTGRHSLYLAALTTGLREGELLGLRWQDVDLENGILRVVQQLSSKTNTHFAEPKTGFRSIQMSQPLIDALRERWEAEQFERGAEGFADHDLVWHTMTGEPIGPRNLVRQYKSLLQKANCPDVRFHDLRHTCATLLLTWQVPLKTVQAILGHSSIRVTGDIYGHVTPAMQGFAADMVGKAFGRDDKTPENRTGKPA